MRHRFGAFLAAVNRPAVRLAAALSRPHFLRFDAFALWFYAGCLGAFVLLSACRFHGSGINIYRDYYNYTNAGDEPALCAYRNVRVDEWNFHTPAILNQLYRDQPLALAGACDGPGKAALLANVPVRHLTAVFRPQFWAFHFLRVEMAFAIYWQAKALLLLTGTFSLLLLLTDGRSRLSALGALWFYFSAFTQWAYSWPSLLPEMIGLCGWIVCLNSYLLVGRRPLTLALAAVASATAMLDFALCVYPPHQLPLVVFGVCLTAGWAWAQRDEIFTRRGAARRTLALALCLGLTGAVLYAFYLDARPVLAAAANTVYPGQRLTSGGGVRPFVFLSHFVDFWKTEEHVPLALNSVNEGTGYFWLAPVTLLALGRSRSSLPRRPAAMLAACWVAFALLATWMTAPVPGWAVHWILFDRVSAGRCLAALGLVNVAIVVLSLCRPGVEAVRAGPVDLAGRFAGWAMLWYIALGTFNGTVESFYPPGVLACAALYAALLVVCVTAPRKKTLAATLLLPLVAVSGRVNPVARDLHVINRSGLFALAQQQPELRRGQWIIFYPWVDPAGFFTASGLPTINSLKIIPQLDGLRRFDPDGKSENIVNQSGYLVTIPLPEGEPSALSSPAQGVVILKVNPLDPRLKAMGVRYAAFSEAYYPPEMAAGLKPLAAGPVSGWMLYELP